MESVGGPSRTLIQLNTLVSYAGRLTIYGWTTKKNDIYKFSPRQIIIDAKNNNDKIGSSTIVVSTLDEEHPYLYTANMGDSGYLLLRKEGIDLMTVYRSQEMQHSFNFPFQIGTGGDDPHKAE
jgi:hypothetical protein